MGADVQASDCAVTRSCSSSHIASDGAVSQTSLLSRGFILHIKVYIQKAMQGAGWLPMGAEKEL